MRETTYDAVLRFWLGDEPDRAEVVAEQRKRWFAGGETLDGEIRSRYEETLRFIVSGTLDSWQTSARGRLATIVVLDQFSRNIYRGTGRAFSQDRLARQMLTEGLARGDEAELGFIERAFLYFPFHHAEELELQRRAVQLMSDLRDSAPEHLQEIVGGFHQYAVEHCGVIERFGRFPHRNELLGRASTAAELDYLAGGADRYGQ